MSIASLPPQPEPSSAAFPGEPKTLLPGFIGCAEDLFKDFDWDAWDALDAEVAKLWNWQIFD